MAADAECQRIGRDHLAALEPHRIDTFAEQEGAGGQPPWGDRDGQGGWLRRGHELNSLGAQSYTVSI